MSNNLQPFESFFALRSLSTSESEVHLVGGTSLGADRDDAVMIEMVAFVRSCLEVLGAGHAEVTQLGEDARWRGIRVAVDGALLDTISRQVCPRLHDMLAGWIRSLYPGIDVIWRPR